jgi:hypothetical protein
VPWLHRAYPRGASRALETLRLLCNRVAHLEQVIRQPLVRRHEQLIEACAWLSPELGQYVAATSSLPALRAAVGPDDVAITA